MYKILKYILLILVISSNSLNAQDRIDLSLSDAIRKGLANNYDIRIERKNVEIDQRNNSWGEAGRYPTVTINGRFDNGLSNVKQGDQFFNGQTFPGFELNNQRSASVVPAVGLDWTLFRGNQITISKRRLENLERESMGNAEIVVANTVQLIILSYYRVVLEEERMRVFEEQLSLSRDKWRYTSLRKDIGSAVSSDLLLEETNYLNDSVNFINQELAYRNALRALNYVLGETDMDRAWSLTNSMRQELLPMDYAHLVNEIEEKNIDLRKQYITQAILANNVDIQRAGRYPELRLQAGYSWARSVQDLTSATSPSSDFQPPPEPSVTNRGNYYANLTLSFTLFDGNRINRAIRNALEQEDIGQIQTEKLRASVYRDLADSYDQYQIRQKILAINNRKEEAAALNLEISTEKYRSGTVNSFDFRIVQNNRLLASITRLESMYDIIDSKIALMRLSGNLLNAFIEDN